MSGALYQDIILFKKMLHLVNIILVIDALLKLHVYANVCTYQ